MNIHHHPTCADTAASRADRRQFRAGRLSAAPRQHGFSLVELMIALTVSLLLLVGLSTVLVNTRQANRLQTGLQQLNENGRYAIELMTRDLRMAGYYGCTRDADPMDVAGPVINNIEYQSGSGRFVILPVIGFEHQTGRWHHPPTYTLDPAHPSITAPGNGDSILVAIAVPARDGNDRVVVTAAQTTTIDPVAFNSVAGIDAGEVLMLGNCERADLFIASAVDTSSQTIAHALGIVGHPRLENATNAFSNTYDTDAELYKFHSIQYVVQPDSSNNNLPTLYREINNEGEEPVIPGVENLQLLYGEDTGGGTAPDVIRPADEVTNWSNVRTIRVALLLRTENLYGTGAQSERNVYPIQVGDLSFPDDGAHVRRRVFETTVSLRNRS